MKLLRLLPLAAVVGLVGLLGLGLLRAGRSGEAGSPLVGKPAPGFRLATLDGGSVTLDRFRGRPVVLNFWASWCVPCREEMPLLERAQAERAKDGVVVVGVVYNDSPEAARRFREEVGVTFLTLLDAGGGTAVQYGITGIPETFFIDRTGQIVSRKIGPLTSAELEARLGEAM